MADEELIEWLEVHNGRMPLGQITRDGRKLTAKEMTKEENYEVNLYARWRKSETRKTLDKYAERPIEQVPESYRDKILKLRGYGLGLKKIEKKNMFDVIIQWLETHEGKTPRGTIRKKLTKQDKEELNLHKKWAKSEERKILDKYVGIQIEDIPEEYRSYIKKLREYGLGETKRKERKIREKTTYEEVIDWLEKNNGQLPRRNIYRDKVKLKSKEMTDEEREESNLRARWDDSKENGILESYKGKLIEEVPENYREKIAKLRSYGLGEQEKTVYEQIIEWLEIHDGEMPQSKITREGKTLKAKEMTKEENYEVNLLARWRKSEEKRILDKYAERPIQEVPEDYREKIAKLRSLGQLGKSKDDKIKTRMKKSVARKVGSNEEIRSELGEIELEGEIEVGSNE